MTRHEFTREEQVAGGKASVEARRAKRDRLRQIQDERAERLVVAAFDRLEQDLRAEGSEGGQAARDLLNRFLGRPVQAVELSGRDGDPIEVAIAQARETLANKLAGLADREGTGSATGDAQ